MWNQQYRTTWMLFKWLASFYENVQDHFSNPALDGAIDVLTNLFFSVNISLGIFIVKNRCFFLRMGYSFSRTIVVMWYRWNWVRPFQLLCRIFRPVENPCFDEINLNKGEKSYVMHIYMYIVESLPAVSYVQAIYLMNSSCKEQMRVKQFRMFTLVEVA